MNDEIKICEYIEGGFIGIIPENRYYKQGHWEPLNPQPSCNTCKIKDSYCAVHIRVVGNNGIIDDNFFCNYYKAKK
jgi:hypothetical protein